MSVVHFGDAVYKDMYSGNKLTRMCVKCVRRIALAIVIFSFTHNSLPSILTTQITMHLFTFEHKILFVLMYQSIKSFLFTRSRPLSCASFSFSSFSPISETLWFGFIKQLAQHIHSNLTYLDSLLRLTCYSLHK